MIPFSGLSRFSGLFDGDGPSPLNRDTTVYACNQQTPTMVNVQIDVKNPFELFPQRMNGQYDVIDVACKSHL